MSKARDILSRINEAVCPTCKGTGKVSSGGKLELVLPSKKIVAEMLPLLKKCKVKSAELNDELVDIKKVYFDMISNDSNLPGEQDNDKGPWLYIEVYGRYYDDEGGRGSLSRGRSSAPFSTEGQISLSSGIVYFDHIRDLDQEIEQDQMEFTLTGDKTTIDSIKQLMK